MIHNYSKPFKNNSLLRIKALIIKEFYQIIRDPSSLMIAFALPLLLLFLFGYGLSLDINNVKIGVVLEDLSNEARSLAYSFTQTQYFDARIVFNMPFKGSIGALCLVTSVFLLASLAMGLLISTTSKNQFVAAQGALISAFLPATLLSGLIFEIDSMPAAIRIITWIIPARYFVPSLQTIFLAGDIWAVLVPATCFLAAMSSVLLAITVLKSSKRLEPS